MNQLINKTITNILIAEDKKAILFETNYGPVIAQVDGDCCSDTWIENVDLPALGLPATVIDVDDLDLPQNEDDTNDDGRLAFYGCLITTDRGCMTIDYRNSSNGYYGGNLCWPGDYHYGGVYGQNKSDMVWRPLDETTT